ncbi:MAG: BolA family protein [Pseudomonadota bacterium]
MKEHPAGSIAAKIDEKLRAALEPTSLEVINESHMHAGHAGDNGTGESHFRIRILAKSLGGKTRVAQHREINSILADELKGAVHALAIDVKRSEA